MLPFDFFSLNLHISNLGLVFILSLNFQFTVTPFNNKLFHRMEFNESKIGHLKNFKEVIQYQFPKPTNQGIPTFYYALEYYIPCFRQTYCFFQQLFEVILLKILFSVNDMI